MNMTSNTQSASGLVLSPMLDRAALIQRWQHGSDSFFWRQEQTGRLRPVEQRGLLRYLWRDVLLFEGGVPPEGSEVDYAVDLMRPDQVAAICNCAPEFILKAARKGTLPARRIGQATRFVPGEVALWQQRAWTARASRMNGKFPNNGPVLTDE